MNLAELKTLIELGGLGVFCYVIWREQRGIRDNLHGLRSDLQAFFLNLMERMNQR